MKSYCMEKKVIAVIGGRKAKKSLLKEAELVGKLIAEEGAILVSGGLSGVMQAASKGAYKAGGTVVGILPQEDKSHANDYVTIPIATGLGIGRNIIIARTADAVIAIGGEYGTLSEIAFSLQLKKPVIGIGSWEIKGMVKAFSAQDAVSKAIRLIK